MRNLLAKPNASASRPYDFFARFVVVHRRDDHQFIRLPAVIIGSSFAMIVAGLPTNSRERLR
jgi:hypothetical protein